jgi:NAD(P)-dependent dehydrogenase (short-subunit alcohol dehydrogenase family)
MTRSLAVEWAKYGIRTNAIAPGPFLLEHGTD